MEHEERKLEIDQSHEMLRSQQGLDAGRHLMCRQTSKTESWEAKSGDIEAETRPRIRKSRDRRTLSPQAQNSMKGRERLIGGSQCHCLISRNSSADDDKLFGLDQSLCSLSRTPSSPQAARNDDQQSDSAIVGGVRYQPPQMLSSTLSTQHLTLSDREHRSSTSTHSIANMIKLYCGISLLCVPSGFKQVGIIGAILGLFWLLALNLFCTYVLIKARNRFRDVKINSLSELAGHVYGPQVRQLTSVLLVATQASILIAYNVFFGE